MIFGTFYAPNYQVMPQRGGPNRRKGVKPMGKAVLFIRDEKLLESLKKRLRSRGFAEIIASGSVAELLGDALEIHAEIAVVEVSATEQELGSAMRRLWDRLGIPIIVIAESAELDEVQAWGESVVATILAKPVREEELMAALVLSLAAARRVEKLKEEVANLKESIESRKVIERAKGRLMERDKLSEAEAFRRMQRLAMDRRISMRQLAEAILLTDRIGC
jgi:two-component system, response regulator PdtaR